MINADQFKKNPEPRATHLVRFELVIRSDDGLHHEPPTWQLHLSSGEGDGGGGGLKRQAQRTKKPIARLGLP